MVSIVVVSYGLRTVVAVIDADVEDKETGDDNGNMEENRQETTTMFFTS